MITVKVQLNVSMGLNKEILRNNCHEYDFIQSHKNAIGLTNCATEKVACERPYLRI